LEWEEAYCALCSQFSRDVQMLTDEEKKRAQQMQKGNPDVIYLNDINVLVSRVVW